MIVIHISQSKKLFWKERFCCFCSVWLWIQSTRPIWVDCASPAFYNDWLLLTFWSAGFICSLWISRKIVVVRRTVSTSSCLPTYILTSGSGLQCSSCSSCTYTSRCFLNGTHDARLAIKDPAGFTSTLAMKIVPAERLVLLTFGCWERITCTKIVRPLRCTAPPWITTRKDCSVLCPLSSSLSTVFKCPKYWSIFLPSLIGLAGLDSGRPEPHLLASPLSSPTLFQYPKIFFHFHSFTWPHLSVFLLFFAFTSWSITRSTTLLVGLWPRSAAIRSLFTWDINFLPNYFRSISKSIPRCTSGSYCDPRRTLAFGLQSLFGWQITKFTLSFKNYLFNPATPALLFLLRANFNAYARILPDLL